MSNNAFKDGYLLLTVFESFVRHHIQRLLFTRKHGFYDMSTSTVAKNHHGRQCSGSLVIMFINNEYSFWITVLEFLV